MSNQVIVPNGGFITGKGGITMPHPDYFPYGRSYEVHTRFSNAKIAFVVTTAGRSGNHGLRGYDGANGRNGANGSSSFSLNIFSINGDDGGDGECGGNGGHGQNGEDARPILLKVKGSNPSVVALYGSIEQTICLNMENPVTAIGVNASGGNGGDGGDGSSRKGRAGRGGNGGDGGDGGDGGNGGNSGRAAPIIIMTSDPATLILFDAQAKKGIAGKGGKGGRGGNGGSGGRGGSGGKGVRITQDGHTISSSSSGRDGRKGSSGRPGYKENDGRNGTAPDEHGSITFAVVDPNTEAVLEASSIIYNAKMQGYRLKPVFDDGIFEPGEEVHIEEMRIANNGELTLPEGTFATANSTSDFRSNYDRLYLPRIPARHEIILSGKLTGNIADIPEASAAQGNSFRYCKDADISPHVELFSRTFYNSILPTNITIQYPVIIEKVDGPSYLSPSQSGSFVFSIRNISTKPYGCSSEWGSLRYKIIFNKHLKHLMSIGTEYEIEEEIDLILPQQLLTKEIIFQMKEDTPFFDIQFFKVELFLGNKKIEIQDRYCRCVPNYIEVNESNKDNFDALLVTNKHFFRPEYLAYEYIFNNLGLRFNIFDIEKYGSFSKNKAATMIKGMQWQEAFQGKLIVMSSDPFTRKDMRLITPADIFNHFCDKNDQALDSGFVVIGGVINDLVDYLFSGSPTFEIPADNLTGRFFFKKRSEQALIERTEPYLKKSGKKNPSKLVRKHNVYFDAKKKENATLKHSLGEAAYSQIPIAANSRSFLIPSDTSPFISLNPKNTSVLVAQKEFFDALYTIVSSLSVQFKMRFLIPNETLSAAHNWEFQIIHGSENYSVSFKEMVANTLAVDLYSELQLSDLPPSVLSKMICIVSENRDSYSSIEAIQLVWYSVYRAQRESPFSRWHLFSKERQRQKDYLVLKREMKKLLRSLPLSKEEIKRALKQGKEKSSLKQCKAFKESMDTTYSRPLFPKDKRRGRLSFM